MRQDRTTIVYALVDLKASECTPDGRLASSVVRATRCVECAERGGVRHGHTEFEKGLRLELEEEASACLHLQRLEWNGKLAISLSRNIHNATREARKSWCR